MMSIKQTSISYVIIAVATLMLSVAASGDQTEEKFPTDVSPGKVVSSEEMGLGEQGAKRPSVVGASITVDSEDYDPTGLSKYIPGSAFIPLNAEGVNQDALTYDGGGCVYPSEGSGGNATIAYAPIELPDQAKLNFITFHVVDSSADHNISFELHRAQITDELAFETATLADADSSGNAGPNIVFMNVIPDDVTGHVGVFGARYCSLRVDLVNAAGSANKVCGAKVHYQVPASGANQTFTPVTPCKIFDSRPVQGGTGVFAANETRTIQVTGDTDPQGGAEGGCGIPAAATAVQVNFVVIDPVATGSIKLWAPVDAEPQGLLAFQSGITSFWNGSGTVPISFQDGQKRMRVKINGGGAHVLVAVTGYTSPVSNMAN